MAFRYSFELNGVELKDISIGSTVIDKLEEPLDEGAFKLAFTTREIEYKMLGYLKIRAKDYDDTNDNNVETFEYIVISDEVTEGSKYGDFIHDLVVVEYTHKYDKYLVHSLAKTKALKNETPAKFLYNGGINYSAFEDIYQIRVWTKGLEVKTTYFNDEELVFKQVPKGYQATNNYIRNIYDFSPVDVYLKVNGVRYPISDEDVVLNLDVGDYVIEYGFVGVPNNLTIPTGDVWLYKYYIRIIPREKLSVFDILDMVRTNISKFGGIESKHNFNRTRLFDIDPNIAEKLKKVEVPQTYIQKATLRQVLNSIFLYVNSISRVKRDSISDIDILTMDEFNEIVGSFEMKNISSYNSSQNSQELSSKGVSWLERVLPDNRERPNLIDPSANGFKTVRSTNIQIVSNKFGLELSRQMYEPKKFGLYVDTLRIFSTDIDFHTPNGTQYSNYYIDLTPRFLPKEEWSLKAIDTDFPIIRKYNPFESGVGMREKKVSNIYWTPNTSYIELSDIYGIIWQETLIKNVIAEALNEQITRYPTKPEFYVVDEQLRMQGSYSYNVKGIVNGELSDFVPFSSLSWQYYRFNLEYITQEDVTVETERDDLTYLDFYSESRLNQSDKLINVELASRKNYGDMQRSGLPSKTFRKIHSNISSILKVGLQDINGFVITVRKLQFYNDYILATYSVTKDHNRLSQYIGLQQSYRAFEIPTSSQIFERIEPYRDYVYILNPNDRMEEELTYIHGNNTIKLLFGNLVNDWLDLVTNGKTRVTVSFVRTDAFVKRYDDGLYFHAIATPVNAFGKKGGVVFQFGFDNNQIALNAVETLLPIGNIDFLKQRYNKAIKYTDDLGKINELWFMLSNLMLMGVGSDWNEIEVVDNYPLVRDNSPTDTQVFGAKTILFRSGDMRPQTPHYNPLIVTKDSSQNIKIPYHLQVLAKEVDEYVIGDAFYTENFLVKNPNVVKSQIVGTKMYVYIYNNHTNYGKFDDLLVKDEYNIVEELVLDTNVVINYANRTFRFIGSLATQIANGSNWAIGDEFENLYMACNFNYNGFNFYQKHFRKSLYEIGNLVPLVFDVSIRRTSSLVFDTNLSFDFIDGIEMQDDLPFLLETDLSFTFNEFFNVTVSKQLSSILNTNLIYQYGEGVNWVTILPTPSTVNQTCSVASDIGNVRQENVCVFEGYSNYVATRNETTNPSCGNGVQRVQCEYIGDGEWLCELQEGYIYSVSQECQVV